MGDPVRLEALEIWEGRARPLFGVDMLFDLIHAGKLIVGCKGFRRKPFYGYAIMGLAGGLVLYF